MFLPQGSGLNPRFEDVEANQITVNVTMFFFLQNTKKKTCFKFKIRRLRKMSHALSKTTHGGVPCIRCSHNLPDNGLVSIQVMKDRVIFL
jgi:hypothetical protein